MLLGFSPQFAGYVREGTKHHTIRALRARPPKVGEICHCYTGLRGKSPATLLGRWPCIRIQPITIWLTRAGLQPMHIELDCAVLDPGEIELFAWRDGFRPGTGASAEGVRDMLNFWVSRNGLSSSKPFTGQVIHWRWSEQ